jgi:rod shape-determining protein MreC
VVSILTHRDERKLFAVIGAVIAAALVALVQLDAAKTGKPGPIAAAVTSVFLVVETGVNGAAEGLRGATGALGDAPHLYAINSDLSARNAALAAENARLREALAESPSAGALDRALQAHPGGVEAATIGYDPENTSRIITIDKGSQAGIERESGVVDADGSVGRVIEVDPFTSKVLLVTDPASKVPAVVQRGRWWGIASGTNSHIVLQFVSQDAKLAVGDAVVTGRGRSFAAGIALGTIASISHPDGALYQTAILQPAVSFGRLDRVVVLPRSAEGS